MAALLGEMLQLVRFVLRPDLFVDATIVIVRASAGMGNAIGRASIRAALSG